MEETQKKPILQKNNPLASLRDLHKELKGPSFEYNELKIKKKTTIIRHLNLDISKLRILEGCILIFFDMLSFFSSLALAQYIRNSSLYFQSSDAYYLFFPLVIILLVNYLFGFYRMNFKFGIIKPLGMMLGTSFISLLFISFIVYLFGTDRFIGYYFGRGILLGTIGGFFVLSFVHRLILNRLFEKIRGRRSYLVLSDKNKYNFLLEESKKSTERECFDFLDSSHEQYLFSKMQISDYDGIIIDSSALQNTALRKKLMMLRFKGFRIFSIQDFFEDVWKKVPIFDLEDQWFVMGNGFNLLHNPVGLKIKRIFDIVFSLSILLCAMPLMILVSILIKLDTRGSVIYSQTRMGERGKKFTLYKFRTMIEGAEKGKAQWAKKKDERVTKVGRLLRNMRIDELPQFWNVLKGEMSIIGPRPERPDIGIEIKKHIPYYNLRYLLKPGITGWAQVLYPYGASIQDALEKLQYDFYYIKNYGFVLDFSIMMKTVRVILFGRGGR